MEYTGPTVPEKVRQNVDNATFYVLHPGEELFRFADSSPKDRAFFGYQASPWWFREREFLILMGRVKKSPLGLLQVRFDAVILQSYSQMDVLVRAIVRRQLDAWMGTPRPQSEIAPNGMRITMPGCKDIQQLFIPDITDVSGMLTYYGRTALSVEETTPLNSPQLWK